MVELIEPGFSTADAEVQSLSYVNGELTLSLLDWREQSIRILFRDVTRFEWTDQPDSVLEDEPLDGMCVVLDSKWPPKIPDTNCKHYRLNFNACEGRLDVACESFELDAQT